MLVFIFFFIKSVRDIKPEVKMEENKILCHIYPYGEYFFFNDAYNFPENI